MKASRRSTDVGGSNVVVLGLARQGIAVARFLCANGANVTVSDLASEESLNAEIAELSDLPISFVLGAHPTELLDGCHLLVLSGGVPPQIQLVQEAVARGIPLSNDALLTLQTAHSRELGPFIAVTGSSGKTTTTSLVGEMLSEDAPAVHVGGNIGKPLIDRLDDIEAGEPIVLELSSFQLELFDEALTHMSLVSLGPQYGAITNLTPNHLDRHPTMAAYAAAKLNLLGTMPPRSTLVLNRDDAVTRALVAGDQEDADEDAISKWELHDIVAYAQRTIREREIVLAPFSLRERLPDGAWADGDNLTVDGDLVCHRSEVRMRGEHNISNILAASLLSRRAGASVSSIRRAATSFEGVAHRLEVVAMRDGITWVNDSIATAPERAVAALRSFDDADQTLILLAGGKDKNLPWERFAAEVLQRVSFLIGFGDSGAMIVNHVQDQARFSQRQAPGCASVTRLDEAVALASKIATPGTLVLLSPGGTSFDAYADFEARGEHFRQLVHRHVDQRVAESDDKEHARAGGRS